MLSSSCRAQLALVVCLLRIDDPQSPVQPNSKWEVPQPAGSLCILAGQRENAIGVFAAPGKPESEVQRHYDLCMLMADQL